VTTFDGRAADHVMKFPRPSPSVFAYCKRSKTGGVEGLGTRLGQASVAEVPYKECFICKPDVTTVVQTKTHGNDFFTINFNSSYLRK